MFDISESVVTLLGSPQLLDGDSVLSAESELTSTAALDAFAASSMSVESDLVSTIKSLWDLSISMSADFTVTVSSNIIALAVALTNGGSSLTANATNVKIATAREMTFNVDVNAATRIAVTVTGRPLVASSSLTATVYVPSKYLVLPTIEVAYTDNVLLERYPIDNGQSLLITSNIGTLTTFPAQEEIADADYYFRGGATNILNDEELAAVEAAGYGEYVVTQ
jgi:hypothetical protein